MLKNIIRRVLGNYYWVKMSPNLKYRGAWKAGQIHGYGHLYYANGTKYSGWFANGNKHGNGQYTSSTGYEYTGGWLSGKQFGQAKIKYKNGDQYNGAISNSLRHGHGEFYHLSTKRYFTGNWVNGRLDGAAEIKDPNWVFIGSVNQITGRGNGNLHYKDGTKYCGELLNFKRHGNGTLHLHNRHSITGKWVNNVNVEDAEIVDENGFHWQGGLLKMKPDSYMRITRPDGIFYDSYWKHGTLVQSLSVTKPH